MKYSTDFTQDLFFYIDRQCDEFGEKHHVIECEMYTPKIEGEEVTIDEAIDIEEAWNTAEPIAF